MYCAYELTRKDGAKGIDGVGAGEYEVGLWEKLQSLVDRLKSGLYRAPAVKRVYIPKAGSDDKRPIGIPTYEDKILHRAVQLVRTGGPMEPIYEQEFYDFSYGFRAGKSAKSGRPAEKRIIPGACGETGVYSEGRRRRQAAYRNTDA
jgi:retron-type reverse transcriptase